MSIKKHFIANLNLFSKILGDVVVFIYLCIYLFEFKKM